MEKLIKALKDKLGKDVISEDVTDDLQAQFDVMVNEKVQELITTKETELRETLEAEMEELKSSLLESLDKYIEYATDEYLKENEVAIEAGSKILAAEKIIEATKGVFKEVGLEIPETEVDHVKSVEAELAEANEKLNVAIEAKIKGDIQIFEYTKAISFQKLTSELAESKVEEVHTLLEGLDYKDLDDFDRKVKLVIEKVKTVKKDEKDEKDLENLDEDDKTKDTGIDKYLV